MWHEVSQYLLLESDELDLKGLGSFKAKRESARIDELNNLISPAKRLINFVYKPEVETSHRFKEFLGKLIGNSDVDEYIEKHVSKAIQELESGNKVQLPLLGYLQKNNNEVVFHQISNYSLDEDNFGYTEFKLPEQKRVKVSTTTQPKRSLNILKFMKYAAILVILVGLIGLGVLYYPRLSTYVKKYLVSDSIAQGKLQDKTVMDSVGGEAIASSDKSSDTVVAKEIMDTSKLTVFSIKAKIKLGPDYDKHYYIIAGSFSETQNAKNFQKELIKAGFKDAGIIFSEGTNYKRVYLVGTDSIDTLLEIYNKYKAKYPDKMVWLLINE